MNRIYRDRYAIILDKYPFSPTIRTYHRIGSYFLFIYRVSLSSLHHWQSGIYTEEDHTHFGGCVIFCQTVLDPVGICTRG